MNLFLALSREENHQNISINIGTLPQKIIITENIFIPVFINPLSIFNLIKHVNTAIVLFLSGTVNDCTISAISPTSLTVYNTVSEDTMGIRD